MNTSIHGPGNQNPSEKGPEDETGDTPASRDRGVPTKRSPELKPIPGPGAPLVPDHQNIDSNPIDPRVF